jgi:hypothetical protein
MMVMKTIEIIGRVDDQHRLFADVPVTVAPGLVRISLMLSSGNDSAPGDAEEEWSMGIAREWHDELADARQDIYSVEDGEPVHGTR